MSEYDGLTGPFAEDERDARGDTKAVWKRKAMELKLALDAALRREKEAVVLGEAYFDGDGAAFSLLREGQWLDPSDKVYIPWSELDYKKKYRLYAVLSTLPPSAAKEEPVVEKRTCPDCFDSENQCGKPNMVPACCWDDSSTYKPCPKCASEAKEKL